MNKRKLHHYLVQVRAVPTWLLIALAIFFSLVSILALRANNQKMIELRAAVYEADEQDGDIEGALRTLREHVYSHMNTSLAAGDNAIHPPIQLKYTYERLVTAAQAGQSGNNDLYTEAQNYCEAQFPGGFSGSNRLPCIRDYLDSHGVNTSADVTIPEDLYKFDFVSPAWSPDLAGWSIVLFVLSLVALGFRLVTEYMLKLRLG